MAENMSLLRALQRIANTSRKFNFTAVTAASARPTPDTPTVLKPLPKHKPLLPLLLSHGVPSKLAEVCSERYDRYATQLRSEAEIKLVPYLTNHTTGEGGTHLPAIYSLFVEKYTHALRDWAQSILNATLKSLQQGSAELRGWDVTYPPPMWLPSQDGHPASAHTNRGRCSISSIPAPSYAFPTTYPPPLRPQSGLSPVEWLRTSATSVSSASTSSFDLDSLCQRFTRSLVIDENPTHSTAQGISVFSLPVGPRDGDKSLPSRAKSSRRKLSNTQNFCELLFPKATSSPPSQKVARLRQLSTPLSSTPRAPRTKSTPRRPSAPARVSVSQHTAASLKPLDPPLPTTTPSLGSPTFGGFTSCPSPSNLLFPQRFDSTFGQNIHAQQGLFDTPTGPTTPPVPPSGLLPEPTISSSVSFPPSPVSSFAPYTDPFTQLQLQCDSLSNLPPVSPFHCNGSKPELAPGDFCSKSAFETLFACDDHPNGILSHSAFSPYESDCFNTFAVF